MINVRRHRTRNNHNLINEVALAILVIVMVVVCAMSIKGQYRTDSTVVSVVDVNDDLYEITIIANEGRWQNDTFCCLVDDNSFKKGESVWAYLYDQEGRIHKTENVVFGDIKHK